MKLRKQQACILITAISVLSLNLILMTECYAKDCGTHGAVFEIAETSLLQVIRDRLKAAQGSGKLEALQDQVKGRIVKGIENPVPVENVKRTSMRRRYAYDPSLIIDEDIKDHKGNVLARKGQKINPLKYMSWGRPMLFIQGRDEDQVKLLAQDKYKDAIVTLVDGTPFALEKELQRPIYYDQAGILTRKFKIKQVPAIITQQGDHLVIDEFEVNP